MAEVGEEAPGLGGRETLGEPARVRLGQALGGGTQALDGQPPRCRAARSLAGKGRLPGSQPSRPQPLLGLLANAGQMTESMAEHQWHSSTFRLILFLWILGSQIVSRRCFARPCLCFSP